MAVPLQNVPGWMYTPPISIIYIHKHSEVPFPNLIKFLRADLHAILLPHNLEKKLSCHVSQDHAYASNKVIMCGVLLSRNLVRK